MAAMGSSDADVGKGLGAAIYVRASPPERTALAARDLTRYTASMKNLAFIIAVTLGASASAAGIDPRSYSCGDLHNLIAARGFVFISQPAFGDFVVAGPYYCGGGEELRLRSIPTLDRPECTVNYCETRGQFER